MAVTGWKTATTTVASAVTGDSGTVSWTNAGFERVDNDSPAVATLNNSSSTRSRTLRNYGFDFAADIPAGSTILGIEVQIKRSGTTASRISDDVLYLTDNATVANVTQRIGSNRATATGWPTAYAYESHGGAADLWDATITAAMVRSTTFGLHFGAKYYSGTSGTVQAWVDAISMRITFEPPVAATADITLGNLALVSSLVVDPPHYASADIMLGAIGAQSIINRWPYSEDISTGWGAVRATLIPNSTTPPSRAKRATKLVEDLSSGTHVFGGGITAGEVASFSLSAKAAERSWIVINSGAMTAYFNIATGVAGSITGAPGASLVVEPDDNGFYRCHIVGFTTGGSLYVGVTTANGVFGYQGLGPPNGVHVTAVQLTPGAGVFPYVRTGTAQANGGTGGDVRVKATAAITPGGIMAAGAGTGTVKGVTDVTLGIVTGNATAALRGKGAVVVDLGGITTAADAKVLISTTLNAILANVVASSTADVGVAAVTPTERTIFLSGGDRAAMVPGSGLANRTITI